MDDENVAQVQATDEAMARAAAIYTAWRNTHLNHLPVEAFNRLEAASPHLIDEIAKLL